MPGVKRDGEGLERRVLGAGGPRRTYWLARVIGRVPRHLDATKSSWIVLLWSNNFRQLIVCTAKKII